MKINRASLLYSLSLTFPSVIYYIFFFPRVTFPKIFADEMVGLDAANFINDQTYERFTGYRAGLGILLQPFLFISGDPNFIYRSQQLTNCAVLSTSAVICFFTLRSFFNVHLAFVATCVAYLFFPALYSIMRISTEIWLALATSIALYLFASLYDVKPKTNKYLGIFVLQFISIVHSRLLILNLLILVCYFTLGIIKKKELTFEMIFALVFAAIFGALNQIFSIADYESGFAESLLSIPSISNLAIDYIQIIIGKIFLLNLESFGLLTISLIITLQEIVQRFKRNTKSEETYSITNKVLGLGLLLLMLMVLVASFFEVLLSSNPIWFESKESLIFATRYVDCMLPPIFAFTIASVFEKGNRISTIIQVQNVVILFLLFSTVGLLVVELNVIISDPMRSPFGFGISKGRPMQLSYLIVGALLLFALLLSLRLSYKFVLIMPLAAWVFASTAFGWEFGIEKLGWQKNHEISRVANEFLSEADLKTKCINIQISNPDNWWSLYNYRFWSEFPVYSGVKPACTLTITDEQVGGELLIREMQATPMYLYKF